MKPKLTDEQELLSEGGGFARAMSRDGECIVMSMQAFREMMGVGDDADYQASLQAVEEGLQDVEAGRTRSAADFFREFDRKHGVSR